MPRLGKPCRPYVISPAQVKEIVFLRDKVGLSFRDIALRLRIDDHTTVYRAYKRVTPSKHVKELARDMNAHRSNGTLVIEAPPAQIVAPQTLTQPEPPVVVSEEVTNPPATKEPTYLAPHDPYDTVPKNTKITDEQMADKINMLIPKLLGMTEGEVALEIENMTGGQRVTAAVSLIDKMRLLRNQSTENVSTNNFVTLISKLTAEIRSKANDKKK